MTKSAAARAAGSTPRTAAARSPKASPATLRGRVVTGVVRVVSPMTATLAPPRVTTVHGTTHPGAPPVESAMLADTNG